MGEYDGREIARKREWNKLHRKVRHKVSHMALPSVRPRCPICNHPSFSRAGVHPQCQAFQNEMMRSGSGPVARKGETPAATG